MYHAHFGLTATPFPSQPSAACYVPTGGHEEVLARLEFLMETQAGSGMLVGPPGCGKTLLLEVFARQIRRRSMAAAMVSAAQADETELLFGIAAQLGVSLPASLPQPRILRGLSDRLSELQYERVPVAVLVDDLDRTRGERLLAIDTLLASLQRWSGVTVVVAGTNEFLERLPTAMSRRADLRIDVPLWDQDEVRQFLATRLIKCGAAGTLFDDGAIAVIFEAAEGNPRRVGQLANLALIAAAANSIHEVDAAIVEEVCRELCVSPA
jgi:type II secretory pathway predicted ATPase ExeA